MSATASPAQTSPRPQTSSPVADVECSCAAPLLLLIAGGMAWFVIGLIFELIASLKFHDPRFLATESFLTYGRIHAAQGSAILYGFGVPTALASGLWMLCRLGRTPLALPGAAIIGALLWNTAVLIGIGGILLGDGTGFEAFEMPLYSSLMLFTAFILMAVSGVMTFSSRAEGGTYPSQWFVLGSLFWFPWIFSTAVSTLLRWPVRGIVQSIIGCWYAQNLSFIVLGFAGLASIFYFIPKLLGKPLHSYYLAMLAFWMLALFGSWGGIPAGSPFPSWIISLSMVGTVLTAVPLLAVAVNFYHTVRGNIEALDSQLSLRCAYVALFFWLISGAQQIVGVLPSVSSLTDYSWFGVSHWYLFHYGFFAFAMFGAVYYIVPRLLDQANPPGWSPALAKWHFGLTLAGVLIAGLAFLVGGVGQGILLSDTKNSFSDVMQAALTPLRFSTLGDLFILLGTMAFGLNFALLLTRQFYLCWAHKFASLMKEPS